MRKLAIVLTTALVFMSIPIVRGSAASPPPPAPPAARNMVENIRSVNHHLDRALRLLNAAEELVDTKQMGKTEPAIDQAMGLVADAERKAYEALTMVREVEATKVTKAQVAQLERLSADARTRVREAHALVDRTGQKTANHQKLRGVLIGADNQIDRALKVLKQIGASL
ncbi:MAG TPA: hypothetical protein VFM39_02730 [bacterium]|nr:hypothetical protein [bacterium]